MKQLDLFGAHEENPSLSPFSKGDEGSKRSLLLPTSPLAKEGLGEIGNTTEQSLDQQRLAHYRNKLAKWETNGYTDVVAGETMSVLEIIQSDTVLKHNQLARDMKIVGTLRQMQWSTEAIGSYFLTRRIKNNRSAKQ